MKVQIVLRPLSDRFADVEYTVTEEDQEMVYDLAEDIREAIFEYQVSSNLGVVGSRTGRFSEVSVSFHNRRISTSRTVQ